MIEENTTKSFIFKIPENISSNEIASIFSNIKFMHEKYFIYDMSNCHTLEDIPKIFFEYCTKNLIYLLKKKKILSLINVSQDLKDYLYELAIDDLLLLEKQSFFNDH